MEGRMKRLLFSLALSALMLVGLPMVLIAADKPLTENQLASAQVATINVNVATTQELQSLPGIGKVTAARIADYRDEHGTFSSIDGLLKVKGVGKKTLAKFRDLITLE
jgi:competence protein ComEA